MKTMYRYLFFQLYSWGLRKFGEKDGPQFSAVLFLALLAVFNMYNICNLAELVVGHRFIQLDKSFALGLSFSILLVHYLVLVRGDRLQEMAKEFCGRRAKKVETTLMWAYPIMSIALFFALMKLREGLA